MEFTLLPPPRRLELTGGMQPAVVAARPPEVVVDPALSIAPQGYRLLLAADGTTITARDAAGAFYGEQTLRQIRRQALPGGGCSCLAIADWPEFAHRGLMIDVSRDRVPKMAALRELVDLIAEWKLNELQLYTEHTFAYVDHEEVWRGASPITADEVRELDRYCGERMIELVPNQNSFGHLSRWLRLPRYRPLAEAPDGFFDPWGAFRPEPFSLCPIDPGSIALLRGLYAELLPHFSSRRFNVGCDETFDLGQGRSAAASATQGKGRVYLDFLMAIEREVARHGRTMMFWGDVILNHPELIPEIPKGVVALDWGYEADHPFAAECERFGQAGVPFFVCPGTSSWNSIAGRTDNALMNLEQAAVAGRAHGAQGYLITDWGDNGHWQPPPIAWLGIAKGAAMAWAGEAHRGIDLAPALDRHAFHDAAGVMGRLAHDLGNVYQSEGLPHLRNASVLAELLIHPQRPLGEGRLAGLDTHGLQRAHGVIEDVTGRLSAARMARGDAELIRAEFQLAASLMRHGAALGMARLGAAASGASGGAIAAVAANVRRTLADELVGLISIYRRLWDARSRPGGLDDSAGRLENLLGLYG